MNRRCVQIGLGILGAVAIAAAQELPERQMNVRQGPDSVFDVPPAEIFPVLMGAAPNGENGRVGDELVFWGFDLADGMRVYLSACAEIEGVDCARRLGRVCLAPAGAQILARTTQAGKVRQISCGFVRPVNPGDLRPGCSDRENPQDLDVALITCN